MNVHIKLNTKLSKIFRYNTCTSITNKLQNIVTRILCIYLNFISVCYSLTYFQLNTKLYCENYIIKSYFTYILNLMIILVFLYDIINITIVQIILDYFLIFNTINLSKLSTRFVIVSFNS